MHKVALFEKVSLSQFKKDWTFEADAELAYQGLQKPCRSTVGSAGYDFCSPVRFSLQPRESILIPTGMRVRIEEGWVLQMFPRSGLGFQYRMQLNNTVGIIDSDYYGAKNQGHILIKITNDSVDNKLLQIEAGERFAQGIFLPFGITQDDDSCGIRTGGFGSTSVSE